MATRADRMPGAADEGAEERGAQGPHVGAGGDGV